MVLNRERLADVLGCSLRTIDEYARQGMPGEAPKKSGDTWRFDSGACIGWLRERERQGALGEIAKVDESDARRRKLAAEAALAEHELALKTGAAVALADFDAAHSAIIGAARAKFLGLPSALAEEVAILSDANECRIVIEAAVKEALRELSEAPPEISIESGGDSGAEEPGDTADPLVGTAPEPDRKPVGRRRTKAQ